MDDGWTVEDLDKLIEDLTNPKNQMGKLIDLRDTDIYALCKRAKKIFSEQPVVLELNAPQFRGMQQHDSQESAGAATGPSHEL